MLGPASPLRAILEAAASPLMAVLGLAPPTEISVEETRAVSLLRGRSATAILLVAPWASPLGAHWRSAVVSAGRYGAAWCLLFNGTHIRLIGASKLFTRRHVEFDLDAACDDERTAAALATVIGPAALDAAEGAPGALGTLLQAGDRHAAGVCRSLRSGVLQASGQILGALALRSRAFIDNELFEQSLTIVYRLLFLLFAEARGLVPAWHPVYRDSYSIEVLRDAALLKRSRGLWDALRAIARLAHAGCHAGSLTVTAFNGRLFSPARTPLAERRGLDDEAARRAIVAVSTRAAPDGDGRERISYRDLGVEQLGAVYETLLDYTPHVERSAGRRPAVSLRPGSGVRKATGSFYTPQPLAAYLLRETLAPLVRGATPEAILSLKVLDPAMGSGAFLVGACRFLADAYESALLDAGRCHAGDIGPQERAAIRRTIAERCLFGVDLNPTAVQLARLSLWLTTLAADRPLTFLDHHLRVGDSLAGTWIARLGAAPASRRKGGELPLFAELPVDEALRLALPIRFSLSLDPNDTVAQVRAKERALGSLTAPGSPLTRWTRVADLWCAAWFASPPLTPSAFGTLADAILTGECTLPSETVRTVLARSSAAAAARRLFHWELEFPEVFFDAEGRCRPDAGFDAVVGNPPWDVVRADGAGDRERQRAETSALVRFARDSGTYEATGDGHANRYQLFVDRAVALMRPGGRLGMVLPSGIVSDHGSAAVRRRLFTRCAVDRIVGFDNRTGTFPIHRSVRFVLLTATAGDTTGAIACRFGETDAGALDRAGDVEGRADPSWFTNRLTPALLQQLSGDDWSIPDLRTPADLGILERASRLFRPLGAADGWHVRFGRELNATEDRRWLRPGRGWPVYEGKLIEPFRAGAASSARWRIAPRDAERLLGGRARRARLAYRDVASATNRVTLIAAVLPPRSASTHTLFCLRTLLPLRAHLYLCAIFNSLVVNFLVRLRVTTHVTTSIVERLPIPREDEAGAAFDELAGAAARLARVDDEALLVRLNVVVARLYQLDAAEFGHVLDTFPLVDRRLRDAMLAAFIA